MRPRPDEYLITTSIGKVSRKFVWNSEEASDLDLPGGWTIEKAGDQLRIRDFSDRESQDFFAINSLIEGERQKINLPSAKAKNGKRPLAVELVKLKAPRPVYTALPAPNALHTPAPRQLCAFYGQRYFLIRYRPVATSFQISIGATPIFHYHKSTRGFVITSDHAGLKVSVGGRKAVIAPGQSVDLPEVDFFRATFITGVHWWRMRMVPTPDAQPPLETDESEEDLREKSRLTYSTVSFLSLFTVSMFAILFAAKFAPPAPKVVHADVVLRQPKIIPPLPEPPKIVEKEPPPPPPKVVEKEPPPKEKEPAPKKLVQKKPQPKKVVQKKEPSKPVAKAEPRSPRAPVVQKVVKEPPPETSKADQKAAEQQAQQQQLMKSLGFLSTSKSRPVDTANYDIKKGRFTNSPNVGGMTSKSNVLDNIAKGAAGDGNIKTRSAREVGSNVKFAKNDGKGLNDVQGKVSLRELASAGEPGGSLGNGKGMEMSGPGQLSESEIEKALAKFLSRFQYCYEKALLSDSGLSGNLVIQWTISASGSVKDSRVVKSQLNNKELHGCLTKILAEVPFPHPKGGLVQVKKTFSFTSSSI